MNTPQRIMVIDRDRDMRQLLNNTLETEGFDTIVVTDSDTTLELLDQAKPDLVILDSGVGEDETLQELRRIRQNSDVPVIILTPRYEPAGLQRALSLGADDYVRKPFGSRSLVARVRAKLRRRCNGAALVG